MAKKYTGSLTLEWFNKNRSIITQKAEEKRESDVPAPRINWINKDEALFYEISEEEGKGLTPYWVDRNDIRVKESRPLVFQKAYKAVPEGDCLKIKESAVDDPEIENILIKGDNLLALNTLKKMFDQKPDDEKVKCIYIDPPYNIQKAFEYYDDNLEHSEWLTMLRDRLIILKELLQDNGYIFVQLDDAEGPYGKVLLDEVFGRENFIVTTYIQVRYNDKTLKEDMIFNKVIEQVHIYKKPVCESTFNRKKVEYTNDKFVFKINVDNKNYETIELGGKQVDIFKEGSYEIIKTSPTKEGLKEIWASGSILDGNSSGRFFRDYLTDRDKIDGYKTLYRVYNIGDDGLGSRFFTGPQKEGATRGKYYQGMPEEKKNSEENYKFVPISNFIDLAAYFGNCRHEGGVDFKSGKKPEILLSKLFEIATNPGDLILDCFGGSGSTFGTAHKMRRKWIGVELGNQADTHIIKRMRNVLLGDNTGISSEFEWKGGGSFKYYHLGESIIAIDKDGYGDFNWSLGRDFIEKSLLATYDFILDENFTCPASTIENPPKVGFYDVNNYTMAGVVSLSSPEENFGTLDNEYVSELIASIRKQKSPQSITIFTNRGVELAWESKPEDVEIIKVPHAIFAELER